MVVGGEMSQESLDVFSAHFGGVAFVVEQDEALDPTDVGFFGAEGVVVEAGAFAGQIEQLFGGLCGHWQLP